MHSFFYPQTQSHLDELHTRGAKQFYLGHLTHELKNSKIIIKNIK